VSSLQGVLGRFAERMNTTASLRSTLAGWNPEFYIQARDSGDTWRVCIEAGSVKGVQPTTAEPGDDALLLRADTPVLEGVFSGRQSPLGAYTDGQLEVYGQTKDQIKLDVIALVLWGA
jgi:hypothetical protein